MEVRNEQNASKLQHYKQHLNATLDVHPIYNASSYVPDYTRRAFSRLRLQSHSLKVETGRWSRIPREERLCDRCDAAAVQDEEHVLVSCSATLPIRQRFTMLDCTSIRTLMEEQEHLKELAEYSYAVLRTVY